MKVFIKFIAIVIFLFSIKVSAQTTIWLDANLKEINQAKSVYYKVVSENKKSVTYFYKSGNVFRKYKYRNRKPIGVFSEFYETGELKISGKYEGGLEEGIWKMYYKNGKIKEKGAYKKGEKVGIWKSFYKNF
ncbi:MAG: hypothetical protein ABJH82_00695 [Polaribacter sp.]|uniref:toxin-antitoxin system YwqK family antitoxin n=1 Tax=Polaribacter sp. TaxID=1920175 RepID=UPI00326535F8